MPVRSAVGVLCAVLLCPAFAGGDSCDTGEYRLWDDYAGGRLGVCEVLGPSEVRLTITPEIEGEINPSPWYSFAVRPFPDREVPDAPLRITLDYGDFAHRYWPKVSRDRRDWSRLEDRQVNIEDGRAVISMEPLDASRFISAQALITDVHYDDWMSRMRKKHDHVRRTNFGYSTERRPLGALHINGEAENLVLVLGRQHPPEVSGAKALFEFVETVLEGRWKACRKPASSACRFYTHFGLLVVPLMNPDGVARGNWRLSTQGVDLNRDWGPFTQPETRKVAGYVERLVQDGRRLRLVLDFHSTDRSLAYTQAHREYTDPTGFAKIWIDLAHDLGAEFAHGPRRTSGIRTAKNYFFETYRIPSITYEVADEASDARIKTNARAVAVATVELLGSLAPPVASGLEPTPCKDAFCHIGQINKASLVMLVEQGLVDQDDAKTIARAVVEVLDAERLPGAQRLSNYADIEALLTARIGPVAANVHLGRSRQDVHGASRRMQTRQRLIAIGESLLGARALYLEFAQSYKATPVPAYTHGVQSQPTSLGHFHARLRRGHDAGFRATHGSLRPP